MKNSYPLIIWSGLFRKKQWTRMGEAIWLFGLFIDIVKRQMSKNTRLNESVVDSQ